MTDMCTLQNNFVEEGMCLSGHTILNDFLPQKVLMKLCRKYLFVEQIGKNGETGKYFCFR